MTYIRLYKKQDVYTAIVNERVYELCLNADRPNGYHEYLGLAITFPHVMKVLQGKKSRRLGIQIELWNAPLSVRRGVAKVIEDKEVK